MFARPVVRQGGQFTDAVGPRPFLDQKGIQTNATAGNTTLLASDFSGGILNRTNGGGAGFTDTWPTSDSLIALMDNPQKGDSFYFIYRNFVAFAMTFAAGTGIVSGIGTLGIAASSTRLYLMTLLSTKRSVILVGSTTNANKIFTNLTNAQIATVEPGMGVTGTGVGASAVVVGVTPSDSPTGASITVDTNSTATADNIPLTFFPRIQLDSLLLSPN